MEHTTTSLPYLYPDKEKSEKFKEVQFLFAFFLPFDTEKSEKLKKTHCNVYSSKPVGRSSDCLRMLCILSFLFLFAPPISDRWFPPHTHTREDNAEANGPFFPPWHFPDTRFLFSFIFSAAPSPWPASRPSRPHGKKQNGNFKNGKISWSTTSIYYLLNFSKRYLR